VDLVLVNVTVLDHSDRAVTGLESANFTVLDDKTPQIIRYLSNVDEPISLVVVLDASASMAVKIREARKALTELVNSSNPQDESNLPARSSAWIFSDFCSRSELESWAPQTATSASRITAGREKRRIVRGTRMPSLAAYLTAGPHSFRDFWEKGG
jgi:VWFA-related protein